MYMSVRLLFFVVMICMGKLELLLASEVNN